MEGKFPVLLPRVDSKGRKKRKERKKRENERATVTRQSGEGISFAEVVHLIAGGLMLSQSSSGFSSTILI